MLRGMLRPKRFKLFEGEGVARISDWEGGQNIYENNEIKRTRQLYVDMYTDKRGGMEVLIIKT